jgi:hypothetical protein
LGKKGGRLRTDFILSDCGFRLTLGAEQTYSLVGPQNDVRRSTSVPKKKKRNDKRVIGFLGVGLDNEDGHQRLTKSEHFLLVGGSAETHERMQGTAIKFAEALRRTGTPLDQTPVDRVIELMNDSMG